MMRILDQESGDLASSLGCHFQLRDLEQSFCLCIVHFFFYKLGVEISGLPLSPGYCEKEGLILAFFFFLQFKKQTKTTNRIVNLDLGSS